MRIVGVIAEYNPFHNGHAYHLAEARRLCKADGVIVVMSGDFVQRGEAALVDKYRRARMALAGGADLVLEMPIRAATGSAENFARGGIETLIKTGCVTDLCFGSETGDLMQLKSCAERMEQDPMLQEYVEENLRQGLPYPKAVSEAMQLLHPEEAGVLKKPNNTLAVEYLKALSHFESDIVPHAVKREGSDYNEMLLRSRYASATAIRTALAGGARPEMLKPWLPETALRELDYCMNTDAFSFPLMYKLRGMTKDELMTYEDMSADLAARILAQSPYSMKFGELVEAVTTRSYTKARVRRVLMHILLDVHKNIPTDVRSLKLLGLRKDSPVAAALKKSAKVPVITKTADDKLGLTNARILAADLYNQAVFFACGKQLTDDYRQSPIVY